MGRYTGKIWLHHGDVVQWTATLRWH